MATETGTSAETDDGTETGDSVSPFVRGATVTVLATLSGIIAGVVSQVAIGDPEDNLALVVLAVAIAVQFPILKVVGIDTGDFGTKDKIYIAFMTFVLWFVSWGILLTSGALQ